MIQSCTYLTHAQNLGVIKVGKDLEDHKCTYSSTTQRRGLRSKFLCDASLDKIPPSNGHLPALWAWTLSACSLMPCSAQRLACGFLSTARTTPCPCRHDGQGLAPWQVWLQQSPQGAPCPLGWKPKALLFPSGNRWEPAKLGPLLIQVCVYRGLFSGLQA